MLLLQQVLLPPQVVINNDLFLQVVQDLVADEVRLLNFVREGLMACFELF